MARQVKERDLEAALDAIDNSLEAVKPKAVREDIRKALTQATELVDELVTERDKFEEERDTAQDELEDLQKKIDRPLIEQLRNPSNWNGDTWRPALATDSDIHGFMDRIFGE